VEAPIDDEKNHSCATGLECWCTQRAEWLEVSVEHVKQLPPSFESEGTLSCRDSQDCIRRELSFAERTNLRGCLSSAHHPFPALRRSMPLARVVACASELWDDDANSPLHERPVEKLVEGAWASTQDLMTKSYHFGSNLARWSQGLFENTGHAQTPQTNNERQGHTLAKALRSRGGVCEVARAEANHGDEQTANTNEPKG